MAEAVEPALPGHRGTRAIQRMVEFAPATGGLALWVLHQDLPPDDEALPAAAPGALPARPPPLLATDGQTLFYRPAFSGLPLAEQAGRVAHAVLHVALRHPQRLRDLRQLIGDVDPTLFNLCADAIVNSTLGHIAWLSLPEGALTLERLLAETLAVDRSVDQALLEWDVERLYRAIDDRRPAGAPSGRERSPPPLTPPPPPPPPPRRGGQTGRQGGTGGGRQDQPADDGRTAGQAGAGRSSAQAGAADPARQADTTLRRASGRGDAANTADTREADERTAAAREDRARTTPTREDGPRAARARALGGAQATDLQPGAAPTDAPEAEADATRAWSERLLRAHAGDGPFSMLRTLIADLPRSRTPWELVLRTLLARGLSTRPSLSWSRPTRSYIANQGRAGPHRRLPWEPGFSGQRPVPRLVVVVDVSGSIADTLLDRFAREIEAITRRLEAALVLVIGDERVQRVVRFEPGRSDLRDIAFHGGGGTDFTPLLEEADRHRPDITLVLTDLDGPARYRPRSPVIWAVPEAMDLAVAPFGRKLSLR